MNTHKNGRHQAGISTRRCVPLRVAVLCSRRAPGLNYVLEQDPHRGLLYEIVCCLTSEESFVDRELMALHGVPLIVHPIRSSYQTHGYAGTEHIGREAYDTATATMLEPYRPDLVVLASYLYVLTRPMLAAFPNRIVNVHHSDLMRRDDADRALFPGLRAVRDAIVAGELETRATVHLVTSDLDQGPPLVRSWPFPVSPLVVDAVASGSTDVLKAYVFAHQEWMIRATWGPLLSRAIELIASGRIDLAALAATSCERVGPPWDLDDGFTTTHEVPLALAARS